MKFSTVYTTNMKLWMEKWGDFTKDKEFIKPLFFSFLLLVASLIINYIAGTYATESASLPVTDIILSNIRTFNVSGIFVYGSFVFWTFVVLVLIYHPKNIIFSLNAISFFVIIRSVFVSLTHLGPFPTQIIVENIGIFNKITFGGDLFFSGHTGLPFLLALIFWPDKTLRYIFLACSGIFAVVVLMGHLHYSIDVLGAFFITYTIFHMAEFIFKKHRTLIYSDIEIK